jgi:serine/threonine protein kinase/tetratricopeptide (TPR) repeat protein
MGEVYEAEDTNLGRRAAIKFLRADLAGDSEMLKRFLLEARAASALNHPNICTIYDMGEADGKPFIVMEFLEGQGLDRKIGGKSLENDLLLDLGGQIAAGLHVAHIKGIIHRDVKPANIFITCDGQVKLLDFGLAKLVQQAGGANADMTRDLSLTRAGSAIGTVAYMSPEQARGRELDSRTDIFSFGVVLYEMATGMQPFRGNSVTDIFDLLLREPHVAPMVLNPGIPAELDYVVNKALEKDPNLRYQSAAEMRADLVRLKRDSELGRSVARNAIPRSGVVAVSNREQPAAPPVSAVPPAKTLSAIWVPVAMTLILGLAIGTGMFFSHRDSQSLTEKDTVVLADFVNSTGDTVFDGTLKQALAVDLGQSPFLNILSEDKVRSALREMTQTPGTVLTDEAAREVCQRTGSKAIISGSIAGLGNEYVIGLNAINCATGDSLVREQVQAAGKEKVLEALGKASATLRGKLGESLRSVEKFDVPPEQATTSSLEALKAFTMGRKAKDSVGAVTFYQRAIELDPNFASAYVRLGTTYDGLGQHDRAKENITKAFQLREHASEREKLHIASLYYLFVTGELEKAIKSCELWAQSYPRDWLPLLNLGNAYSITGQYEKAVEATRESLKFHPDNVTAYENLAGFYLLLNRLSEAKEVTAQAQARKLDDESIHTNLYSLAFLQGDSAAMAQQESWFDGKPEFQSDILALESATEAYSGRLSKARELSGRAIAVAENAQNKDSAALWSADAALREALFGNYEPARDMAGAALNLAPGSSDAVSEAALALAFSGDVARTPALTEDISKHFPLNTVTQSVWLPTIRAQLAVNRKAFPSAVGHLQAAVSYELGLIPGPLNYSCMYPAYVRGTAYLAAGKGASAAGEFQKILDHRGLYQNCPTGALAHLGLARSFALQGNKTKARAAYQDFLTLWKDADSDIPILNQAKAESAALK